MKMPNGTSLVRAGAGPVEGGSTSLVSGLECRVGKAPLAIPVESIAQIIEYQTVPLPLARRWIAGIGLHEGRLEQRPTLCSPPDYRSEAGQPRALGWTQQLGDATTCVDPRPPPRGVMGQPFPSVCVSYGR